MAVRLRGVAGEIPTLMDRISNPCLEAGKGTMLGRRFDWGGFLQNCNGGARRYTQSGWQSFEERKGISVLNCETDTSSRCESRS